METTEALKNLQILLLFSPVIFTVFFIAYLIKRGIKYLHRYKTFWLFSSVLFFVIAIVALIEERKGLTILNTVNASGSAWATYMSMRKRENKKKIVVKK